MKPVTKAFTIFILGLSLTIVVCGQTSNDTTIVKDTVNPKNVIQKEEITETIGKKQFTLQNNDGECQLVFNKQNINLDIPWKCNFHRLPDGKVRVFPRDFYEAKNKKTPNEYRKIQIILIEYSVVDEESPKDCKTQLQAIKISNDKKITKSVKMDNIASCPPFQWDNINFIGLFE